MEKPNTTIGNYFATAARDASRVAFRWRDGGSWRESTWAENAQTVRRVARALISLGFEHGSHLAIIGPNRPEWMLAALGAQAAGGVPVGIYTTSTPDQVAYIAGHCEAKVAVVHDVAQLEKFRAERARLPALKRVVLMTGTSDDPWAIGWKEFLSLADPVGEAEVDARIARRTGDDVATLIYTSGTTGTPKAVMLSHANLVKAIGVQVTLMKATGRDEVCVSYLPLSHVAEQNLSLWVVALGGGQVGFCEKLDELGECLRAIRPTVFLAVPRVWEKIQATMVAAGAQNTGLKKRLVTWARGVGLETAKARSACKPPPLGYGLAKRLVFSKVRERLGLDRCRIALSGAAALSRSTLDFFHALDIPILEVYGMSESTAVISMSSIESFRLGAVGRCLPGFELKLAPDGEVLARGPHVFKGYFKDPKATAETIDAEGWLHTGDIGELDADGFLRITDRKKELFKTAGGKYIAPQYLEGLLKAIPGIGQAVVVGGDARKYVAALLVLDPETAPRIGATLGLPPDLAQLASAPAFVAHVQRELDKVNAGLAQFETVKKVKLLPREFSVDGGELTPTMKLRRKVIAEKYAAEIEALFAE